MVCRTVGAQKKSPAGCEDPGRAIEAVGAAALAAARCGKGVQKTKAMLTIGTKFTIQALPPLPVTGVMTSDGLGLR